MVPDGDALDVADTGYDDGEDVGLAHLERHSVVLGPAQRDLFIVMALHGHGPTWLWPYVVMALHGYGPTWLCPYMVMPLHGHGSARPAYTDMALQCHGPTWLRPCI